MRPISANARSLTVTRSSRTRGTSGRSWILCSGKTLVFFIIREDGRIVGGLVLKIDEETQHNELELLFVNPEVHSRGIGFAAWQEVERLYPETLLWKTCTPYFETRNIHFYVNKCGFHIVEFFNRRHPEPESPDEPAPDGQYGSESAGDRDGMFLFEKQMQRG
ncbi:MAG: GNAT family N-acetyltransferase [Oscillospiraceae bacterium]|nr:GNAT family N-acetyltransferase [Oscillospiraceae bacterium]